MRAAALRAIDDAEVIAYLHPLTEYPAPPLPIVAGLKRTPRAPIVTVYTKSDLATSRPDTLAVSAKTGAGIESMLATLRDRLPESPFHYNPDDLATQPMRFFAAEFIREAAFELLHEELPYSVACEIDEFREAAEPVYIRAVLYVERDSQKGIVIGEGGRTIKALGAAARAKIETLLGQRVFLDLHVKVLATNPRSSASATPPHESRPRLARDSRLPEMQRLPRAPHPTSRSARLSQLPADLRGRGRHPHHAHR